MGLLEVVVVERRSTAGTVTGLAGVRYWGMPVLYGSESDVAEGSVFDGDSGDYREEFLYAVEVARSQHDPATDWDGFRDTLWEYLARVFGVDIADPDTSGGTPPDEGVTATQESGRPTG